MIDQRDLLAGGDLITSGSLLVRLPASTSAYRILCIVTGNLSAILHVQFSCNEHQPQVIPATLELSKRIYLFTGLLNGET